MKIGGHNYYCFALALSVHHTSMYLLAASFINDHGVAINPSGNDGAGDLAILGRRRHRHHNLIAGRRYKFYC